MVKMCPNCKVETESKFCPKCGAKIEEMAARVTSSGDILSLDKSEDDDLIFRDEECDDAETYYRTAEDYYYGKNGKNKDDEVAAQWYLKAAEQGHVESYYCLGSMLQEVCEHRTALPSLSEKYWRTVKVDKDHMF